MTVWPEGDSMWLEDRAHPLGRKGAGLGEHSPTYPCQSYMKGTLWHKASQCYGSYGSYVIQKVPEGWNPYLPELSTHTWLAIEQSCLLLDLAGLGLRPLLRLLLLLAIGRVSFQQVLI